MVGDARFPGRKWRSGVDGSQLGRPRPVELNSLLLWTPTVFSSSLSLSSVPPSRYDIVISCGCLSQYPQVFPYRIFFFFFQGLAAGYADRVEGPTGEDRTYNFTEQAGTPGALDIRQGDRCWHRWVKECREDTRRGYSGSGRMAGRCLRMPERQAGCGNWDRKAARAAAAPMSQRLPI